MTGKRVIAALSGGVDSAVAAALLKDAGYDVTGIHLRLWPLEDRPDHPCCGEDAVRDARQVCASLRIGFHILDFQREFRHYVYDHFNAEYARGRTPNPCIVCNKCLKFGFLMDHIAALEADYLATGHYARIVQADGIFRLLRGANAAKDQSYVLHTLDQDKLRRILFPLGNYSKSDVRQVAREKGLSVSEKPDSQDVCFVYTHSGNLDGLPGRTPGDIVNRQGNVLGRHTGIANYTIGQRRGLGISSPRPVYVVAIDAGSNRVVVGDEASLMHRALRAGDVSWVSGQAPTDIVSAGVKIRYKSPEAAATLVPVANGVEVHFQEPQRAITPGQAAVFYRGDEVMGGGTIEEAFEPT